MIYCQLNLHCQGHLWSSVYGEVVVGNLPRCFHKLKKKTEQIPCLVICCDMSKKLYVFSDPIPGIPGSSPSCRAPAVLPQSCGYSYDQPLPLADHWHPGFPEHICTRKNRKANQFMLQWF